MGRYLLTICLVFLLTTPAFSQSYGLAFNSHESVPEKRTSLDLSPDDSLCFSGQLRLEFEMNFIPGNHVYFGYLLRILNHGENIDFIYDQKALLFRITAGKTFSGLSFPLDSAHLFYQWNKITILINPRARNMQLFVNEKKIGTSGLSMPGGCFKFLWGANDYSTYQTRDIPPMRLRDIKLFGDGDLKYHWPLNDIAGDNSLDDIHHRPAMIKNGAWIRSGHRSWDMTGSFTLPGNVVTAFDKKNDRLYIAGSDSVLVYDVQHTRDALTRMPVGRENILPGSQAVYDTITDRLYTVFIDQQKVASYHPNAGRWDVSFDSALTEFWHPNKFISSIDTSLYTIGGYGQLKYKNTVHRYQLNTRKWESVPTQGDFFPPRYLAALGLNQQGDTAYIMGGYGSPTGDQMLNPVNYYDLFAFDVRRKNFKKIFDLDSVHSKFTFANSLVIDSKHRQYYGLIFPNDSFNSNLRVIRGSLDHPSFQVLGNEIPFAFYDLQSYADLYYSPKAGKLIAVTLFYAKPEAKEKITTVKVYTIDFPPEYLAPSVTVTPSGGWIRYSAPLAALALAVLAVWMARRKYRQRRQMNRMSPSVERETLVAPPVLLPVFDEVEPEEELSGPRIFLFGQFQVFDKEGLDITNLFSPMLRELFLLILIHTFKTGRGISAEELTEILWTEKRVKDAKNNRSVNIAKLKSILEKIGPSLLVRQSGFWQFQTADKSVYVDYRSYLELFGQHREINRDYIKLLLRIVKKGSFLSQTEYNWLDNIKVEVSNDFIETCLRFLRDPQGTAPHPELVIAIANGIFHFDQLNEDALEYKCRSLIALKRLALANKTFARFAKDYKDIYGEEFSRSFHEIIHTSSPGLLQR